MDINEIRKLIPHRYPFLLVDRITRLDDRQVEGWKNVTVNEPFFAGHFPDYPVMPGVLIIEALAQVCGVLVSRQEPMGTGLIPVFAGIEDARFRRPVQPGDVLRLCGEVLAHKGFLWKCSCHAYVGDTLVCSATLLIGYKAVSSAGSERPG